MVLVGLEEDALRSGAKKTELKAWWEAKREDESFDYPTWMEGLRPQVTSQNDLIRFALNVVETLGEFSDPRGPVITVNWYEGGDNENVAKIRRALGLGSWTVDSLE